MKKNLVLPRGRMGYLALLVIVSLTISAMIASVNYFQYSHPACVNSAGDRLGGGSPTSSWGKIDGTDVLNGGVQPLGCFGNLLVYMFLIWLPFALGRGIVSRMRRVRDVP